MTFPSQIPSLEWCNYSPDYIRIQKKCSKKQCLSCLPRLSLSRPLFVPLVCQKNRAHLQLFLEWESPLTWRCYFLGCGKCSMYKDKGWHGRKEGWPKRCTLEQPLRFLGLLEFKQRCVYLDIIDSALIPGHNIGLKRDTWANLENSVTIIRDKDIVWQISWTSESPALEPGPWRGRAFWNYCYFAPQVCSYSHRKQMQAWKWPWGTFSTIAFVLVHKDTWTSQHQPWHPSENISLPSHCLNSSAGKEGCLFSFHSILFWVFLFSHQYFFWTVCCRLFL